MSQNHKIDTRKDNHVSKMSEMFEEGAGALSPIQECDLHSYFDIHSLFFADCAVFSGNRHHENKNNNKKKANMDSNDKATAGNSCVQIDTKNLTVPPADQETEKKLREKTKHIGQGRELETDKITKEGNQQKK